MEIYKITNQVTGDFYIGKTERSTDIRWKEHLQSARLNSSTYLHCSIRKYGPENFSVETLEESVAALNEREQYWITKMSPKYNMTSGGDGGRTRYPEWTPERRKAMSVIMTGKKHSEEVNRSKAKYGGDNHFFGKKHSEESKKRMSESSKGQVAVNAKSITVDGVYYKSQDELCRTLKIGKAKARKLYYDKRPLV